MPPDTAASINSQVTAPDRAAHPAQLDKSSRYAQLDLLRGIAILSVLLLHCLQQVFQRQALDWHGLWRTTATEPRLSFYAFYPATFGWAGVSLFYVLSGFVIHGTFFRAKEFSVAAFYWRRFWRIYPPYLLALIFCSALLWHREHNLTDLSKQLFMHLFLIHNFRAWSYFGISPPFWSLATEMQFYLLYPLLLLVRWRIGIKGTLLAVLGVSVTSRAVCYAVTDWTQPISIPLWYNVLNVWFDWTLGMYIAEQFHFGKRVFTRFRGPLVALLIGLLFVFDLYLKTTMLCFTVATLISAVLLESALYARPLFGPLRPFLTSLGLCSYSFYLWHAALIKPIAQRTHVLSLQPSAVQYFALVMVSLLSIYALSYFLYVTVEKPAQRVGKWMPWARKA